MGCRPGALPCPGGLLRQDFLPADFLQTASHQFAESKNSQSCTSNAYRVVSSRVKTLAFSSVVPHLQEMFRQMTSPLSRLCMLFSLAKASSTLAFSRMSPRLDHQVILTRLVHCINPMLVPEWLFSGEKTSCLKFCLAPAAATEGISESKLHGHLVALMKTVNLDVRTCQYLLLL